MKVVWKKIIGITTLSLCGGILGTSSLQARSVAYVPPKIILNAELANPVIEAGRKQTTFLKVGLTGFKLEDKAKRIIG